MVAAWEKVRIGDIAQTNVNTYATKENWGYVNYLDTGNLTKDEVDEYQHIVIGKDKLPSRARRKVKKMTFCIQQCVQTSFIMEL